MNVYRNCNDKFIFHRQTMERISFMLPMLWTFLRNLIQWPTPEQWINMASNWEHFPREIARVAAIRFVY